MDSQRKDYNKLQFLPKSPLTKALGLAVEKARKKAGLDVHEVRNAIGCSLNRYRMGEAGASPFRADEILRIAKVLNVKPAKLLDVNIDLVDVNRIFRDEN